MCDSSNDCRLHTFSNTPAAEAGIAMQNLAAEQPWLRKMRYGPSGLAIRTVHHSTNHTCLCRILRRNPDKSL